MRTALTGDGSHEIRSGSKIQKGTTNQRLASQSRFPALCTHLKRRRYGMSPSDMITGPSTEKDVLAHLFEELKIFETLVRREFVSRLALLVDHGLRNLAGRW